MQVSEPPSVTLTIPQMSSMHSALVLVTNLNKNFLLALVAYSVTEKMLSVSVAVKMSVVTVTVVVCAGSVTVTKSVY